MRISLLLCLLLIQLFSPACKDAITEQSSIDEVLANFGGAFGYTVEGSVGTSGNSTSYTLNLAQSETAEDLKEFPALVTSGVALAFYNKLKDQTNCTVIEPEITLKSGDTLSNTFTCLQLKEASAKKRFFFDVADMLKNQQYDSLGLLVLADTASPAAKQEFLSRLNQIDQETGKVKSATLLGFIEVEDNDGRFIRYTGITVREKRMIPLSVVVERNKLKVVYVGFKM